MWILLFIKVFLTLQSGIFTVLNFGAYPDPDPAFHSDTDPDADPASRNDADPDLKRTDPSGFIPLIHTTALLLRRRNR
jgi:hypothetical protein